MTTTNNVLMSIRPAYVEMIVSGRKTVEIRKRAVRTAAGARIWIYATSPRQQVVASARLEAVTVDAPDDIWRAFGERVGIDRRVFSAYVGKADVVAALSLTEIAELDVPLRPRDAAPAFRPPRSWAFLRDAELLATLEARSRKERSTGEAPGRTGPPEPQARSRI